MSRRLLLLASAAVLALGVACGGASGAERTPPPSTPTTAKPRLAVFTLNPLTVRGYGFKARERVTVTVDGGRRGTQRLRATRRGRFTTSFESVRTLRCRTLTIRAVGSRGSRAFRQLPSPDCRQP